MTEPFVDLPGQDPVLVATPTDILSDLRAAGRNDLFFFANAVLRYDRMTEACHGPLCSFVQHNPSRFKRILYPRDHYKSTCVTIAGNMWLVVNDPEHRIHIKNEKESNASRFLRAIRTHAESNSLFRTLYGSIIPPDPRKVRWNDLELDFVRKGTYPEPTFSASGMTSATTSQHFSHICIDDPISRDAVQSEKVMAESIERMKDMMPLLTRPMYDSIWLVGTRWAYHDVYSWWDENFGTVTGKFSRGATEDGVPIFPELLSLEMLDLKRRVMGEYLFSCLYQNSPRNDAVQDLDVDALLWWDYADASHESINIFDRGGRPLHSCRVDSLDVTACVDLAPAESAGSDRNCVTVVGVEPVHGYVVVLDVFAERCSPLKLIEHIAHAHLEWPIRKLGIEGVAYQKAFKYFLHDWAERHSAWFNIHELKAQGKKEIRIRGLQPIVKVGRMAIHPTQSLLRQEMADFPLGAHDDTVDSLSMHLQIASHWFSQERTEKFLAAERMVLERAGVLKHDPEEDDLETALSLTFGRYANVRSSVLG